MAIGAAGAQLFLVRIFLLVTRGTCCCSFMIFLSAEVACLAASGGMCAFEREVCLAVVKGLRIEMDDVSVSAQVITVAARAVEVVAVDDAAMEAALVPEIGCDIVMVMAPNAAPVLGSFAEGFMAVFTVGFKLCMTIDQFARHQHGFQRRPQCAA